MSKPVLDLNGIKTLFSQGLQYAKDRFPGGLFSRNDKICDYQLSLVNQAQDLTTLINAIAMPNPVLQTAYKSPEPICSGCELQYNPIQFGVGNRGWYFSYGIAGDICYVLVLWRTEIAPPHVVEKAGLEPIEATRWYLGGGFGKVDGPWYAVPNEAIYMSYQQPSYSTFTLTGSGSLVKSLNFSSAKANSSLNSLNGLQFEIDATFLSPSDNNLHSIKTLMISNAAPSPNFANACGGCNSYNGTLYYSFTDMDVVISSVDGDSTQRIGKGWMDRQLVKSGIPSSLYEQAQLSVINNIIKPVSAGWLWFAIQDLESNKQYMLTHFFGSKFYQDDIKLNDKIQIHICNVYEKGIVHFNPTRTDMDVGDLEVRLVQTAQVNGMNMPAKYNITLPGGKKVILALASTPYQFTNPFGPYENPAFLYSQDDTTLSKPIGVGLIEANAYFNNQDFARRLIQSAGGNPNDSTTIQIVEKVLTPNTPQTFWQRFAAVLIVLIPLWLLLIAAWFVFSKKEGRSQRIGLSFAILLILYAATR